MSEEGSNLKGGYMGKFLRADLTTGTLSDITIDSAQIEHYVGGAGLGGSLLADEVPAGVGPFDPENRLIFAAGPLSGTVVPGSGTYTVATRGPLTGLAVGAQANGWFGARLKAAGYDGIIVQGASPELVTLVIDDGKAELRDASDLVGMDTTETQNHLQQSLKLPRSSVACIGPAGEKMVRFANICSDHGHSASTNGVGAVMGSKRLKAVVVNGQMPVPVHDRKRLRELAKQWSEQAQASAMGFTVHTVGTAGFFTAAALTGWLPIKNMTTNLFEPHPKFNGDALRASLKLTRHACHACPLHHCNHVEIPEGRFKGLVADEPEYEGMAGFGALIGNEDPYAAIALNDVADRLGMDLKECSFTMALAFDCFENGLLTAKDTDGLQLHWGDFDAARQLMYKMAAREGIGELLSEGVYRSAHRLGPAAVQKAVYTHKGLAPHVHDPRGLWGFLFGQAISNMGSIEGFTSMELIPEADLGYTEPVTKYEDPAALVESQGKLLRKYYFVDSVGVCYFVCGVPLPLIVEAFDAITGLEWTMDDAMRMGHRVATTLRQFNIRHGWTREQETLSPRLAAPSPDGPNAGISIAPVYDAMVDQHYAGMGWDVNGVPTPETLQALGIA
jgi:aldehyde:ferredoxin oxidoreductase